MSSKMGSTVLVEMPNEETLRERLAKLPFALMFLILVTGFLSYYFERQTMPQAGVTPATEEIIQRTIAQRQAGNLDPISVVANEPVRKWYWIGSLALVVPGLMGVFFFTMIKSRRNSTRRRSRL